ncbi:MAG TPA: hypothetical protein VFI47_26575, partial [Acidimicrobiales bacterium]|nr:hypothetical protein [Acidimicrobiales bacterium]
EVVLVRKLAISLALGVLAVPAAALPSAAEPPPSPNCLGVVTAQRAVALGDIGEHASSQDEPRLGLGNAARVVLGDDDAHVGEFGALLGEIDGIDATNCP